MQLLSVKAVSREGFKRLSYLLMNCKLNEAYEGVSDIHCEANFS